MQNYFDMAEKNGVVLSGEGACQFCGANTRRGIHECLEIFNLGFKWIDYSKTSSHVLRFLSVDAHALQHSEVHGRWSNHFHLLRQHLMFQYGRAWNYALSPLLSDHLNRYKSKHPEEELVPPPILKRGDITTTEILERASSESECIELIWEWGRSVYATWEQWHGVIDRIAVGFSA